VLDSNRNTFTRVAEKTQSLRESEPDMKVPRSIYGPDDNAGSISSSGVSIVAPSDLEFDFDDQIVNSKVYRKFLAQAIQKKQVNDMNVVEGDLIDFSDELTIKDSVVQHELAEQTARLLRGLKISDMNQGTHEEGLESRKDNVHRREAVNDNMDRAETSLLNQSSSNQSTSLELVRKPISDSHATIVVESYQSLNSESYVPVPDLYTELSISGANDTQKTTNAKG
jgi:DNA-binding transcriptional MocR family regulator